MGKKRQHKVRDLRQAKSEMARAEQQAREAVAIREAQRRQHARRDRTAEDRWAMKAQWWCWDGSKLNYHPIVQRVGRHVKVKRGTKGMRMYEEGQAE